jgi:hypothetical protein
LEWFSGNWMPKILELDGALLMNEVKEKTNLLNSRGSALMMAMISAAILGAIAIMMMQSKKTATFNQIKETSDRDMDRAAQDLGSMLANPAHCNATFVGVPLPATDSNPSSATYKLSTTTLNLTSGFNKCTAAYPGTCSGGTPMVRVLNFNDSNWKLFNDSTLETSLSKDWARAKITKAAYKIIRPQTMKMDTKWPPAGQALPATLQLTVQFTKLLGRKSNGDEITSMSRDYNYEFYVITGRFYDITNPDPSPPSGVVANSPHLNPNIPTTIIGCARTPDSTIVY